MGQIVHLHLDPLGGLAGDMFLAALLDTYPEHAERTFAAMRAAGLPDSWQARLVRHDDGALGGHRVVIEGPVDDPGAPPAHFADLRAGLEAAPLDPAVRERAIAIFTGLAEAEAAVHGVAIDEVHFHELADWDSVADIVGAAWLIEALAATSWSVAPLPVGSGRIDSRHGPLPVPAPAAARLLRGFAVHDDGIAGERVTPTGAAILRHLAPAPKLPAGQWRLAGTGHGFGTRRLGGISNALRVVAYHGEAAGRSDERVAVIAFEVDDQSAEELAAGLDALRATAGVLDVVQLPAFGKKGRLATQIQVLARPERLDAAIDRCFAETTTIGLRWRIEARAVLAREVVTVAAPDGEVEVKVVARPDGARTAKAEIDQVAAAGHAARATRRRAAEARALATGRDGEREPEQGG
jgi:pyridinium-3,5-bisthiocarboxylic acid mononucleotide nickel chelatase